MSIQSNINAMLGTGAVFAHLSPTLQDISKFNAEGRELKKIEKKKEAWQKGLQARLNEPDINTGMVEIGGRELDVYGDVSKKLNKRASELRESRFNLRPSQTTYNEYIEPLVRSARIVDKAERAAELATGRATNAIKAKKVQRLKKDEFFRETSFMGTKGGAMGLPKDTKNQIWNSMTAKERRDLYESEKRKN